MLRPGEEVMIIDEMRAGEEGEWIATLSIVTADLAQADRAFAKLSATALDLSHDSVSQMVSKHSYGDDSDEENFTVDVIFKVMAVLKEHGVEAARAWEIIDELHKENVVFKER